LHQRENVPIVIVNEHRGTNSFLRILLDGLASLADITIAHAMVVFKNSLYKKEGLLKGDPS